MSWQCPAHILSQAATSNSPDQEMPVMRLFEAWFHHTCSFPNPYLGLGITRQGIKQHRMLEMVIALLVHMLFLLLAFCDFHCSEIQSQEFQASVQETCQVLDIAVHLDSACRNVNGHPGDCVPGVFLELMSTYVLAIRDWRRAQDLGCRTTCGHGQR